MAKQLGYACINMTLSKDGVSCNKTMIRKTFQAKGIEYASEIILKNPDGEIVIVKEKDWVDFYKKVLGYKSGNGPCALRNGRTKKTRRKDHEGKKGWIIVNIEEVSARETRGRNQNY